MDGRSEKPDAMQDPRRTEVGNRVDPSLAKGFVKQMLKRAEQMTMMPPPAELGEFRNPKARFRAIQKLKKAYGEKFIAAVASKDYIRVDVVLFYATQIEGKDMIGVTSGKFDLRRKSDMPSMHWVNYPMMGLGSHAYLTKHALIRLAQRGGAKTFEDFISLMKPFWAWATVAHEISQAIQRDFQWFLPTQNGLFSIKTVFAIKTETSLSNYKATSSITFTTSNAKTYIDRSDMRPSSQEIWERLTVLGILEATPRFPRLSLPKEEEISMFAAMILEGEKWHDRYEHAVAKGAERDPNLFR